MVNARQVTVGSSDTEGGGLDSTSRSPSPARAHILASRGSTEVCMWPCERMEDASYKKFCERQYPLVTRLDNGVVWESCAQRVFCEIESVHPLEAEGCRYAFDI